MSQVERNAATYFLEVVLMIVAGVAGLSFFVSDVAFDRAGVGHAFTDVKAKAGEAGIGNAFTDAKSKAGQ